MCLVSSPRKIVEIALKSLAMCIEQDLKVSSAKQIRLLKHQKRLSQKKESKKEEKVRLSNISMSHVQGFCLVYFCSG